jgi:exonuclease VII small subunit
MNELDIQPMSVGQQRTATQLNSPMRGASDVAIAEQFCTVAAELRSILQTMKISVELQREMVEALDKNNKKLDESIAILRKTSEGIDKTSVELEKSIEVIQSGIDKNDEHINELNKNSRLIVRAITSDDDYQTLNTKIVQELEQLKITKDMTSTENGQENV